MTDWTFCSAGDQAEAIRSGAVTSRDLVEAYLARIDERNSALNAIVTIDADGARRSADERDRDVRRGAVMGPLHGVPITVKDCFETVGLRTTSGMTDQAGHVPDGDAVAVARLRAAGVVLLGKTNLPAEVTGQETANEVFGTTNNPWDVARTPGGSSGGAAAAVAAGLSALDVGSDSGGSIRQPASYCGIYGHYPTQGLIPPGGHLPQVPREEVDVHVDLMSIGPLARDARDLALVLDVLAGPDRWGQRAWRLELPPPAHADLRSYRVAVWADDPNFPVDSAVRERVLAVAAAMDDAGAAVDADARPSFDLIEAERVGFALWVAASSSRTPDEQHAELVERAREVAPDDDRREARRARAETMDHRAWLDLDAQRRQLQRSWDHFFEEFDVLLCPVTPTTAPRHDPRPDLVHDVDHRLQRNLVVDGRARPYLDQLVWPTIVGLARLPATAVPIGRDADGLPIGMQVVGANLHDRTTIDLAEKLADLIGGYERPPAR